MPFVASEIPRRSPPTSRTPSRRRTACPAVVAGLPGRSTSSASTPTTTPAWRPWHSSRDLRRRREGDDGLLRSGAWRSPTLGGLARRRRRGGGLGGVRRRVLWALREDGLALPGMDVLVHGTVPLGAGPRLGGLGVLRRRRRAPRPRGASTGAGRRRVHPGRDRGRERPTGWHGPDGVDARRAGTALLIDFDDHLTPGPLALDDAGLACWSPTPVSHALVDGGYGGARPTARRRLPPSAPSPAPAPPGRPWRRSTTTGSAGARHVVTEVERVRGSSWRLWAGDWTPWAPASPSRTSRCATTEISAPSSTWVGTVVDPAPRRADDRRRLRRLRASPGPSPPDGGGAVDTASAAGLRLPPAPALSPGCADLVDWTLLPPPDPRLVTNRR